jgi:hypothetical protein
MRDELKNNLAQEPAWKGFLIEAAYCIYIFYILPCAIALIFNFSKFVIFGDCKISKFNWGTYSYQQVNNFYLWLLRWCAYFKYALWH